MAVIAVVRLCCLQAFRAVFSPLIVALFGFIQPPFPVYYLLKLSLLIDLLLQMRNSDALLVPVMTI